MRPSINATGMLFYNGYKEPPLAAEAVCASNAAACSHGVTEGVPGSDLPRRGRFGRLFSELAGVEDALVLNNISAAVFLVFHALAEEKEIIVHGKEISNNDDTGETSFPLSTLAKQSGAKLILTDQKENGAGVDDVCGRAVSDNSACLLTIGSADCAEPVDEGALVRFAKKHNLISIKLMDFATLLDLTPFGLPESWQLQKSVAAGFDIIIFSGDKLLGGPPAGIVAGKKKHLLSIKKDSLMSAFSADRMKKAALEATLELYFDKEEALQKIPLLRMISARPEDIERRARYLADTLKSSLNGNFEVGLTLESVPLAGPPHEAGMLQSYHVSLSSPDYSARQICSLLSKGEHPVVAGNKNGKVLFNPRFMLEEEDDLLINSLLAVLEEGKQLEKEEINVLDIIPTLVWVLDADDRFVFLNKASAMFWGTMPEDLLHTDIKKKLAEPEVKPLLEARDQVLASGEGHKIEAELVDSVGTARWFDIELTPFHNSKGGYSGVLFTASDVTEHKQNEEKLKYLGMHDHLTGLYNRLYFEEEMSRLDAERHYPISIISCDVDGLKLVNDIFGHGKGDELLETVASIIKKPFRSSDVVARVGGDEFAVILPRTDENVAREITGRIRKLVEEHNKNGRTIPISLSIGCATGTSSAAGIKDIFERADNDMYKNKFERSDEMKRKTINFLLDLSYKKDFKRERADERLRRMVLVLGQAVGMSVEEIKKILLLSRIYDIGEVGIDKKIILKEGELSASEWDEIKSHPEIGWRIAKLHPETALIADYILQHHEHWDGGGYPRGLRGNNIHLFSRIISIIDAYEAMTSPRPYRDALTHEEAIEELKKNRGIQFDPRLIDIFISLLDGESLIK